MYWEPFIGALKLLIAIMLIDGLICGLLFPAHWILTTSPEKFDFFRYLNLTWAAALLFVGVKTLFAYYPALLVYLRAIEITPTNYSLLKLYPGLIALFLVSASTYLAYTTRGPKGAWPSVVTYEAPFGNDMYIALFASVTAPLIVKGILIWLAARKKPKASQAKE